MKNIQVMFNLGKGKRRKRGKERGRDRESMRERTSPAPQSFREGTYLFIYLFNLEKEFNGTLICNVSGRLGKTNEMRLLKC